MTVMEENFVDSSKVGCYSNNGLIISVPVETRQEALTLSNSLMKHYATILK